MSVTNTAESRDLEMDQLQGKLRKEIGGRKYLLVLDDVWNEKPEEWLNLSAILKVAGGEGSKILVTTRSMIVADIMGTVPTYVLEGLSEDKSWALFEKMAFKPGESQNKPHLVKLGTEIIKKCAAVPLAITILGSLLRVSDERKWVSVASSSFAELPDKQKIMAMLKLSYDNLLSPLKCCFAYCALFPKDYDFEKETLIDLWMAEGFVVPAVEGQSLNDLGDEYLSNLLQRCFFQDITRDEWGNISRFKMHDLMHDLALEVSGTESIMQVIQDGNFSNQVRHLSIGYRLNNSWKIPVSMLQAKQLRTLLLPVQISDGTKFNRAVVRQLISNFKCMRVLDLHNLGISSLPKSIGMLIHLRYLNLSMNPIKELPRSITRLLNLQTLNLYQCHKLRELPIHTRNLTNLRSIDIRDCFNLTHIPSGLGGLTSIHKLPYFVLTENRSSPKKAVDSIDQEETSLSFSELNKLRIVCCKKLASFPLCPNVEELSFSHVNKHLNVFTKLTSSTVNGNVGSSKTISGYGSKLKTLRIDDVQDVISLPQECLGRITSLEIKDSNFSNTSILKEVFKRLRSLSCLTFNFCSNLKSISEGLEHLTVLDKLVIKICWALAFPENEREDGMPWKDLNSLRSLHFEWNRNLKHLPSGLQHLKNLRSLRLIRNHKLVEVPEWISCLSSLEYMELCSCSKLKSLPEEFGKLTNLNALDIRGCEGLTKRCRGPNGRDWPKIKHIPLLFVEE